MQKITPNLWFNDNAEEAVEHYVSIFNDSMVGAIKRYGEGAPFPPGTLFTVSFQLEGQDFMAINGGPQFQFTPAISLVVSCEDQAEVDSLWERLGAGGQWQPCGWLQDKFGVSWQIIPKALYEMLESGDEKRANQVMAAMLQMGKIDIAGLREAWEKA